MFRHKFVFFVISMVALPGVAAAASCSRANLTRCLDSACAINIQANPAARCQYCGTADAGVAPTDNAMKSVSVGTSSKNTLSAKELRAAPDDPGQRYVWASRECLKKLPDCTPDDIEDTYDSLIEQSCRAAGISAQMLAAQEVAGKTKTSLTCKGEIMACLIADTRCTGNYRECKSDADFDKFFSECNVSATGCDEYSHDIRRELIASRDTAIKNASNALTQIVTTYKSMREGRLASARTDCANNIGRDACIAAICERSMANNCAAGFEDERSMATQLCKFYDIACATLD